MEMIADNIREYLTSDGFVDIDKIPYELALKYNIYSGQPHDISMLSMIFIIEDLEQRMNKKIKELENSYKKLNPF